MSAFVQALVGLLAITNPLTKGPIFAGIVEKLTPANSRLLRQEPTVFRRRRRDVSAAPRT